MARTKKQVTLEEFEKFIKDYPKPLKFDGLRYTEDVEMRGGAWHKPIASKEDGKYYLISD
jgi:hypothetical protein